MKALALIFPGQGSQYVGMAKGLHRDHKSVRDTFQEASDTIGMDLAGLCFEGPTAQLTLTTNAQPAILTVSVAMFRAYMEMFGQKPVISAGHSLGEFSALTCAGAIAFPDALKIVRRRGQFMGDTVPSGTGAMAAVSGIDVEEVRDRCNRVSEAGKTVAVSNVNSLEQAVISGDAESVRTVMDSLTEKGAQVTKLQVSGPFHCQLMKPAEQMLRDELEQYAFTAPTWPVVSNVAATPYSGKEELIPLLTQQLTKAVQWQASIEYMDRQGTEVALELGPGSILRNLTPRTGSRIKAYSFDRQSDLESLSAELRANAPSEGAAKSNSLPSVLTRCLAIAVCTKNSNWDSEAYQRGVVEPYRKIQRLQDKLEQSGSSPTLQNMRAALSMLQSVFETKGTPSEERCQRFEQVLRETGTGHLFPEFSAEAGNAKSRAGSGIVPRTGENHLQVFDSVDTATNPSVATG